VGVSGLHALLYCTACPCCCTAPANPLLVPLLLLLLLLLLLPLLLPLLRSVLPPSAGWHRKTGSSPMGLPYCAETPGSW
jgi:hypothetical protein